ncbi:potassium transport system, low affinity (KUP family) [Bradyrhizobium sp. ORS 278]|uniref:Probable potassium transport system protein Kup 1 n=1 Tax=Bradyrhizobium sp. (strain ORS 278) TaxID=114615 RepID=KUP1_BRASO|nr:potassium transporter Kup [Bradyrhizobium sp. ORS 278]A4YN81.1 RecName: Full=Probable potassium transport system protein Kup 1 [Bradyrhizobium sp. ORS 278]CAL75357.1 potassium transport system, low affinity (KUP family) [Bradyrhizobium sp. ORS 278]
MNANLAHQPPQGRLSLLALSALGIVFGDIGTSPLYTFKTILGTGGQPTGAAAVLGALSLVIWTLFIITTVKYVMFAMRVDNDGEGGILALMALLGVKRQRRPTIVALGLFGAALIYGDGAITPAISVLSALEGLNMAAPALQPYVVPAAVVILLALFAIQSRGTASIGRLFGPVMLLWFVTIAVLGLVGIARHPTVFAAINPSYGLSYLVSNGATGFLVLGSVFLCVTGAEALYADMGHFGAGPIKLAWFAVVFPSLIINYAGQAALVIDGAPTDGNIFFRLCPDGLLLPLIGLATLATIIASQSVITGAFSMTRQAIQLGWMPRLAIKQTSSEGYGQIYVGAVNWLLMLVTVSLTIGFGKSDNLASAYGIAVSLTMLMTSALLFIAMREIWQWSLLAAGAVAGVFLTIDSAFFLANLTKIAEGGYVPLLLATSVYGLMWIWHRGAAAVAERMRERLIPVAQFMADIAEKKVPRVPGTAVFLTRTERGAPPVMLWHVKHNRALHEHLLVLRVEVISIPWVAPDDRLKIEELAPNVWRAEATFGFMERPHIPELLKASKARGCRIDLDDITYYVGHETVTARDDGKGLPAWQEQLFAAMERNSLHVSDFFSLPRDSVVEIGRQVAI